MRSLKLHYILSWCLLLISIQGGQSLFAAPVTIDEKSTTKNITPFVEYIRDHHATLSIDQVNKIRQWQTVQNHRLSLGYTTSVYWFKIAINSAHATGIEYFLKVEYPLIHHIDFYQTAPHGGFTVITTGADLPFYSRDMIDRNFIFRILLKPGVNIYYFKIQTSSLLNFSLFIQSKKDIIERTQYELPVLWVYYGMMIILIIFNLVIFLSARNIIYLYCMILIASITLFLFHMDGLSYQYLWPDSPWWAKRNAYILICSMICSLSLYISSFLETDHSNPRLHRVLTTSLSVPALPFALIILVIPEEFFSLYKIATLIWVIYGLFFLLGLIIHGSIHGQQQSRILLVGISAFLVAGIFFGIKSIGFFPMGDINEWPLKITSLFMVFLFSMGLVFRLNNMRRELRNEKETLFAVFQHSLYGVVVCGIDDEVLYINPMAVRITGYAISSNKKFPEWIAESSNDDRYRHMIRTAWHEDKKRKIAFRQLDIVVKNGVQKNIDFKMTVLPDGRTVVMLSDISDRIIAEEALLEEKERLRITLESIAEGVITTDTDGTIMIMNHAAETITGQSFDLAVGKPLGNTLTIIHEFTRDPFCDQILAVLKHGEPCVLTDHIILIDKEQVRKQISVSAAPIRAGRKKIIGIVIIVKDITFEKEMDQAVQRARQIESIGLLAGGIAHDFNNILTAIIGNINLARFTISPEHEATAILADAEKAVVRATSLTEQMLTFSRGGAPIRQVDSIAEILREITEFTLRGSNVKCNFNISENLNPVMIDPGQIGQVINNIIINALQAMPDGGTIDIGATNESLAQHVHTLKPGNYVKISIRDYGAGIPEEHLPRIFDPYFTTKKNGYGLGLTSSFSIINRHGGYLYAEAAIGSGTVFYIFIPASSAAQHPGQFFPELHGHPRGRVLIMDDNLAMLEIGKKLLALAGYRVDSAAYGAEAIKFFKAAIADNDRFNAVIVDLAVRGTMGGKDIIERMREIDPDIIAVISSDYSNDPIITQYAAYGFNGIIIKPFTFQKIISTIHSLTEKSIT